MAPAIWVAISGSCFPGGYLWLLFSQWLCLAPVLPIAIYGSCSPGDYLWLLFSGWVLAAFWKEQRKLHGCWRKKIWDTVGINARDRYVRSVGLQSGVVRLLHGL
jgi:hypothetical protein